MPIIFDQLGRPVEVPARPQRIVSVVPSQTELLAYLGLDSTVVGITTYCVHPAAWKESKIGVGGTKKLDLAAITALQPDLIIANKEENDRAQIETLAAHFPVWVSDIATLPDAYAMMLMIGDITGTSAKAQALVSQLEASFAALTPPASPLRVLYLIWRKPYMAAAGATFIDAVLQAGGWQNAAQHLSRYPILSVADMQTLAPDVIFLSSEPYPFREKHIQELKTHFPTLPILLVDGELFSWYGSRLLHTASYISLGKKIFFPND